MKFCPCLSYLIYVLGKEDNKRGTGFFLFLFLFYQGSPFPPREGFVGDGVLDIPLCSVCFNKTDDHWSSLQVAVHLCVIPHVLPYMSLAGRRGAVPYKIIERLYVIPSVVEGSQTRTPHHLRSRSLPSRGSRECHSKLGVVVF